MEVFLIVLLSVIFFWIAWQDLKSKNVFLASFLIGYIVIGVFLGFFQQLVIEDILMNLAIVGFMSSIVGIYYILRYRQKFVSRINSSIGLGDLLMLPFLILYFAPYGFVLFLIISFLVSILYWMVLKTLSGKEVLIPLAGIQSLLIPVLLWYDFLNS